MRGGPAGGGKRVTDVALKYGCDSPTAFNRAFRSVHGVTPSSLRKEGSVRAFPPISFQVSMKGAEPLDYRIETKQAFRIVGISCTLDKEIEKIFSVVPKMWEKAASDGTSVRLAGMTETAPKGLLGVSARNDEGEWKYFIAVSFSLPADGFEEYEIPLRLGRFFGGRARCDTGAGMPSRHGMASGVRL